MPYQGETASKLGHLTLIESPWVRDLVASFEQAPTPAGDPARTPWRTFDPLKSAPLSRVWAVDGSFVQVRSTDTPPREVAFVKTALVLLDREQMADIDPDFPHPLDLRDAMAESGLFHATAFPLRHVRTTLGNNYTAIRHIIHDSIRMEQDGAFYETLKWLAYRKWATPTRSPDFQCPHCGEDIADGLPPDSDDGACPHCGEEVFLTDMPGFHQAMGEDAAPLAVASDYMLVMEHLMLFTPVRLAWHGADPRLVGDTLFLKDGPLTLRGQYSKLVEPIRAFLQHTKQVYRPVHIVGQEKTGAFVDHLTEVARFAPPQERAQPPSVAVLTHDFVRKEVQRMPERANPYGLKTNWGEKVYLKLDPATVMVLSIPTGDYCEHGKFPVSGDLIGLDRVLATLPGLVSRRFEGGLYPIELANGIASLSSYPSAKILQRFLEASP
jgi:hypothetical protein